MEPHGSGTTGDQASESPAIWPEDFSALSEMVGLDLPEVLVDLIDTYLDESQRLVAAIAEAAAAGNVAAMLRPSHSLKSSSASVGARQLSALSGDLESYVRGHLPVLDVERQVALIQEELVRVQAALKAEIARLSQK
jgi:HPt (histidine-containing phosphotransfer) domain-containing protein